jgi:type VI secretion system protein ImpM
MPDDALTAWLFGKLPTHGDFVFRGLSMEQRDRLDLWLSEEMEVAREQFGAGFEESYDNAPPWCFSANAADGRWNGGAICPSMDSVGRRFPIIVARNGLAAEETVGAAQLCVDAIYRAFEESMTVDALSAALAELAPEKTEGDAETKWWVEDENHEPLVRLEGEFPAGLVSAMLEGLVA